MIVCNTTGSCQLFKVVQFMIKEKNSVSPVKDHIYCVSVCPQSPVLFEALLFDIDLHVNSFTNET